MAPKASARRGTAGHPEKTGEHVGAPERKNVRQIADLEGQARAKRTPLTRFIDLVAAFAGRPSFLLAHVVWFAIWFMWNRGTHAIDPYPYNFLTMVVSLEAILLSAFVLMAQNRMAEEADRRAKLDLQINLLAEQELTAILRALCLVADKAGVDLSHDAAIQHFRKTTDVQEIAELLENTSDTDVSHRPDGGSRGHRTPNRER